MAIGAIGPGSLAPSSEGLRSMGQAPSSKASLGNVFDRLLGEVNAKRAEADKAVQDLAMGKVDNLHNVMLSIVKADLSFRMVMEIRNRLTDAYQEIMRMTI
jgi:flagellar hook-basal body complex protein FliE